MVGKSEVVRFFGELYRASLHRYFTPYVFLAVLPFSFRAFVFLRSARLFFFFFFFWSLILATVVRFSLFSPPLSCCSRVLRLSRRFLPYPSSISRSSFLSVSDPFFFVLSYFSSFLFIVHYSPPLLPLLRPLHPLIPSSSSFSSSSSFPSFTPCPHFLSPHQPPTHLSSQTLLAFSLFTFLTSLIDAYFMFVFTATE